MDEDTLWTTLISWASTVSGLQFIRANQNGPAILAPFGTINIVQSLNIGIDEDYNTDLDPVDIDLRVIGWREIMASINVYNADSVLDVCEKMKLSLEHPVIQQQFFEPKIGYLRTSTVQRIPQIVKNEWQNRGQFDVFFNVLFYANKTIESIEEAFIDVSTDSITDTVHIT